MHEGKHRCLEYHFLGMYYYFQIDIDGTICDDIPNEEPERMETRKLQRKY